MTQETIKAAIAFADAASIVLKTIPELYQQSMTLKGKLAEFAEQDRNPTALEWKDIDEVIESLHSQLDAPKV